MVPDSGVINNRKGEGLISSATDQEGAESALAGGPEDSREENRAIYRLRRQTVEPVFGVIKQAMGFRQFLLRGEEKIAGERELSTLAYNCKRLDNLMQARA